MAKQAENYMIQTYNKFQSNGLDSSESSNDSDDNEAQDLEKPEGGVRNRKKKNKEPKEPKELSTEASLEQQDQPTPVPAGQKDQRGEISKCWNNSQRAMRKTVSSILLLLIDCFRLTL